MEWVYIIMAGICEVIGVSMIHSWNNKRAPMTMILLIAGFGASFLLLSMAMKELPMGMAYAIWTGIGASGGAVVGMVLYGESKDWRRFLCIACIISAAVGLKLVS
jgi:paired small multidrug resistance pump